MKIYGIYSKAGNGFCVVCAACVEEILAVEEEQCIECENCGCFPSVPVDINDLDYEVPTK